MRKRIPNVGCGNNTLVALTGIDGSGKTTIIEEIRKELVNRGERCKVVYMGFGRNFHIPLLGRVARFYSRRKYSGEKKKVRDNYRTRSSSWLAIQYLEMLTRYLVSKRRGGYTLFDRYFFDGVFLADEKNSKILKKIIPKADKMFFLYASPEVIQERKEEASKEQIEKYHNKINELSKDFEIIKIDNSGPLKEVVEEIMGHLNEN